MRAAWYDRTGPAAEVLHVGELPGAEPGPDEVRVRVTRSAISPGDVKKREGWLGSPIAYPRVIPHSDGAGVVEAVGDGVDPSRLGRRVWMYGAQSYRPFGTAAELTVVPQRLAVDLPDGVDDRTGACLGIPGITAHRAVFADGPVAGQVVLVHGVLGAVGGMAAQLARWGGARVIGTVRRQADADVVAPGVADEVVVLDESAGERLREVAGSGVDRIVEVAFSANIDLDATVLKNGTVIATYMSPDDRPSFPFSPLLFDNVVIRLLGSDDFPPAAKAAAVRDLTEACAAGALRVEVAHELPLTEIARAHDLVASGRAGGRVLLTVP